MCQSRISNKLELWDIHEEKLSEKLLSVGVSL